MEGPGLALVSVSLRGPGRLAPNIEGTAGLEPRERGCVTEWRISRQALGTGPALTKRAAHDHPGKLEKSSMQAHSCESGLGPRRREVPPRTVHTAAAVQVERRVNRICFHGIDPTASAHYARRGVFATINDNYDNSANPGIALRLQSTCPPGRIAELWVVDMAAFLATGK